MRINIEYLKDLLAAIQDHDMPDFYLNDEGISHFYGDKPDEINNAIFHLEILRDEGLLQNSSGGSDIGFKRGADGYITPSDIQLRLTSQGHQFAADLCKPGVFEQLNTTFRDLGPGETVKAVFKLGAKAVDAKLQALIGDQ